MRKNSAVGHAVDSSPNRPGRLADRELGHGPRPSSHPPSARKVARQRTVLLLHRPAVRYAGVSLGPSIFDLSWEEGSGSSHRQDDVGSLPCGPRHAVTRIHVMGAQSRQANLIRGQYCRGSSPGERDSSAVSPSH